MDLFTQVKSAEHMAKFNTKSISNQGTFCNFSLAPKRKIYKTSMKHLKIHKFPFRNVIVLAIECKMYLKIQQKLRWLGCISKQTMGSAVKKTRLNSSKDDFLMKSFPFSTKKKLSILLNFLFPFFVFYRCIFNLEMQNSCLKTSAWWSRSSHFVENGYPSLKISKYGQNEYSRALNASYTFQPLMSFWYQVTKYSIELPRLRDGLFAYYSRG